MQAYLKSRILRTINVPEAPARAQQNQAPAWPGAGHLWRVGPSTRGATAPQRAQRVFSVVRRFLRLPSLALKQGGLA